MQLSKNYQKWNKSKKLGINNNLEVENKVKNQFQILG